MKQENNSSKESPIKSALIDFYLALKQYSLEVKDIKKEELNFEYLSSKTELELINYIKDSIDTVVLTLAEKKINEYNNQITCENIQTDYESMLIKYEQDIRGHIKVEHQLKLYSDSLQSNLEELEKEKKLGFNSGKNNNNNYINEIEILKKEINYQKKLIKSYEEQNLKSAENEKKLKSTITKIEKRYKNDIDNLNKKIREYIDKINILTNEKKENTEKRKSETICSNSSRRSNNPNLKNYIDNESININKMNNSLHGIGRLYRNPVNNISISDNHSTSMANSRPYVKLDKYILNKYIKDNKGPYLYQNRVKNIKNVSNLRSNNIHSYINIQNNNNNNSYILDSKAQDEMINKFMMNDNSFLNTKRIYNRHKSVENNPNNYFKGKNINIKKLLMKSNNNTNKNSYKDSNKGFYNRSIMNKKYNNNSQNNSVNSEKHYMNKTTKEININNIIENKNNIGCNFVNNINIYSNNLKQDNGNNNIFIGNNIKKYTGNTSFRGMNKNNNLNEANYIHIHGNKNNMISYRNKPKEGKAISAKTNSVKKKY